MYKVFVKFDLLFMSSIFHTFSKVFCISNQKLLIIYANFFLQYILYHFKSVHHFQQQIGQLGHIIEETRRDTLEGSH